MAKTMELLKETSHYDKDNRYMAISDLCNELENDMRIEVSMESKVCMAILKRLDDQSNDVQSIAVKCLALLVKKVHEEQVQDITDKLCNSILTGKDELRDIYSIGLKAAIAGMPAKTGEIVASRLCPRLTSGINSDNVSIKLECLDIMSELLVSFGKTMPDHPNVSKAILQQLSHQRAIVRKRATHCLGNVAVVIQDTLLDQVIEDMLNQIESSPPQADRRTLIQAIGTISKTVGYRMGGHITRIITLFLSALKKPEDESMQNDQADELRENILNGLKSFVVYCPTEVAEHLTSVTNVAEEFLVYDPNYNYDSDEGDAMEEEDEEEEEEYDDDDYSDDDDTSWKVRRSSIRLLHAIVLSRPRHVIEIFSTFAPLLIKRFKEREDSVKLDIIGCLSDLVSASAHYNVGLSTQLPALVGASVTTLKQKKNIKSKVAVFSLLCRVSVVLNGGLEDYLQQLLTFVANTCQTEKDAALKHEVLLFLNKVLNLHSPKCLEQYIEALCPAVVSCVSDDWYKLVAQSLRVVGSLIKVIRPRDGVVFLQSDFDFRPYVKPLYEAVLPKLSSHDIDQEIKESAIATTGTMFSYLGDTLTSELPAVLELLNEKLKNEMTRLEALKALAEIAESPLRLNLSESTPVILEALSHFLRQQSRSLKEQTLEAMNSLTKPEYCKSVPAELFEKSILPETANLISDRDLHLARLAIGVSVAAIRAGQPCVAVLQSVTLPATVSVLKSPLLHEGKTLDAILLLLKEITLLNDSSLTYESLIAVLQNAPPQSTAQSDSMDTTEDATGDSTIAGAISNRNVTLSLAKAFACIVLSTTDEGKRQETVKSLIAAVKARAGNLQLALCSLGEIGRSFDLKPANDDAYREVSDLLEVRTLPEAVIKEAAGALGNITVGSMDGYLPGLVTSLQVKTAERQQHFLLTALLQIIAGAANSASLVKEEEHIFTMLERNSENKEEGVRNMVAECIGKLANLNPEALVPRLSALCSESKSSLKQWTLVTSLKQLLANDKTAKILEANLAPYLGLLNSTDLGLKRATLLAINSIAHHQPKMLLSVSSTVMPVLFSDMSPKPELKRKVDLGPFKHTIDDGLPLRKAAFSSISTILTTAPHAVNIVEFLPHLATGLADDEDIQLLCHEIIGRLCELSPLVVIANVNTIVPALNSTLSKKIKEKGDVGRSNDVLRSAIRTVQVINSIPQASQVKSIQDLWAYVQSKSHLRALVESLR